MTSLARALLALGPLTLFAHLSHQQEEGTREERPPHELIDRPPLAACGGCHAEVYEEWARSLHAGAWTNPNVRSATRDFEKKSCRPCHSPRSVFETGFERRPAYRDFNQLSGVHCLSCHGLPDGVAAARTVPDAPCKPTFAPELLEADHCYPCHEPTHQAFQEYRTSDAFQLGLRCVDCHMQVVPRKGGRSGRSHGPHGGLNAEFVRKAISWDAKRTASGVEVTLRNRTGHKFPGEIPSRSFVLRIEVDGEERHSLLLRKPFRGEKRRDNRLLPDEVRVLPYEVPGAAAEVRVRLFFLPFPLLPLDEGFPLGERSL